MYGVCPEGVPRKGTNPLAMGSRNGYAPGTTQLSGPPPLQLRTHSGVYGPIEGGGMNRRATCQLINLALLSQPHRWNIRMYVSAG